MKEEKQQQKRKDMIGRILEEASRHPKLSGRITDMIDRLLVGNDTDSEQEAAFTELFESIVKINRKPSKEALRTLDIAKRRLGMKSSRGAAAIKIPLYRRTYFKIVSAAAVIAIAAGISLFALLKGDDTGFFPGDMLTIMTIEDVSKEAYLSDSTHVWVNENSKLDFPSRFSGKRHVKLEGEAYFEVKHDRRNPFHVHTEHLDIEVLGTSFDIAAYPETDFTEVIVFEGQVRAAAGKRSRKLQAGEKLTYDHISGNMTVEKISVEKLADWRTGFITANQKTMPQLLRMVSNYYDIIIHFDHSRFSSTERYSIAFGKDDGVEKVLEVLSDIGGGFSYRQEPGKPPAYVIIHEP